MSEVHCDAIDVMVSACVVNSEEANDVHNDQWRRQARKPYARVALRVVSLDQVKSFSESQRKSYLLRHTNALSRCESKGCVS